MSRLAEFDLRCLFLMLRTFSSIPYYALTLSPNVEVVHISYFRNCAPFCFFFIDTQSEEESQLVCGVLSFHLGFAEAIL